MTRGSKRISSNVKQIEVARLQAQKWSTRINLRAALENSRYMIHCSILPNSSTFQAHPVQQGPLLILGRGGG